MEETRFPAETEAEAVNREKVQADGERLLGNFDEFNSRFDGLTEQLNELALDNVNVETAGLDELRDKLDKINNIMAGRVELNDDIFKAMGWGGQGANSASLRTMAQDDYVNLMLKNQPFMTLSQEYEKLKDAEVERAEIGRLLNEYLESTKDEVAGYDTEIASLEELIRQEREKLEGATTDIAKKYHESLIRSHEEYMNALIDAKKPVEAERANYEAELEKVFKGGDLSYKLVKEMYKGKETVELMKKDAVQEKVEEPVEDNLEPEKKAEDVLTNPLAQSAPEPPVEEPKEETKEKESEEEIKPMTDKIRNLENPILGMDEEMSENEPEEEKAEEKTEEKSLAPKEEEKKGNDEPVADSIERGRVVKAELAKNPLIKALTFIIAGIVGYLSGLGLDRLNSNIAAKTSKVEPTPTPQKTETVVDTDVNQESEGEPQKEDGGSSVTPDTPAAPTTPETTPAPAPGPDAEGEKINLRPGDVAVDVKTNQDGSTTKVEHNAQGQSITTQTDAQGKTRAPVIGNVDTTKFVFNGQQMIEMPAPDASQTQFNRAEGQSYEDYVKNGGDLNNNLVDALLNGDPVIQEGAAKTLTP